MAVYIWNNGFYAFPCAFEYLSRASSNIIPTLSHGTHNRVPYHFCRILIVSGWTHSIPSVTSSVSVRLSPYICCTYLFHTTNDMCISYHSVKRSSRDECTDYYWNNAFAQSLLIDCDIESHEWHNLITKFTVCQYRWVYSIINNINLSLINQLIFAYMFSVIHI